MSELPNWAKPGVSFDETYGNENDHLWHIRGIVDDMAVCRRWRSAKQRWHYEVLSPIWFEALKERLSPRKTAAPDPTMVATEGDSHE